MLKLLITQRRLIWPLAKNDFRKKFAGSYLGVVWALVQPVVTVLVYWFVFQVGLRQTAQVDGVPFILWMLAGLVPWFYFNDALQGGTKSLIEYSYLVKKVVFRIEILPIVKAVSALYVHAFFVALTWLLYCVYGKFPGLFTLQVFYYTFCMFLMVLSLSYGTSAITVLFRDMEQLVAIVLQIGVWATPIMWNLTSIGLPKWLVILFKMNPMYYIVTGYRHAIYGRVWFFERGWVNLYFWAWAIGMFVLGNAIFRRLKVHFADVL